MLKNENVNSYRSIKITCMVHTKKMYITLNSINIIGYMNINNRFLLYITDKQKTMKVPVTKTKTPNRIDA